MKSKHLILAITAPTIAILDQITKMLARAHLQPLAAQAAPEDRFVNVIDGFFRLIYAENKGAAWGLLRDASPTFRIPFFIIVSLLAVGFIIWYFKKLEPKQRLLAIAISSILGGALGNLIDRIIMNKVVDFIDWYVTFDSPLNLGLFTISAGEHHWPTFNIADIGISVGVILLLIDMLFFSRGHSPVSKKAKAA